MDQNTPNFGPSAFNTPNFGLFLYNPNYWVGLPQMQRDLKETYLTGK